MVVMVFGAQQSSRQATYGLETYCAVSRWVRVTNNMTALTSSRRVNLFGPM